MDKLIEITEDMVLAGQYLEGLLETGEEGEVLICVKTSSDTYTKGKLYTIQGAFLVDNAGRCQTESWSKFIKYTPPSKVTDLRNTKLDCRNPDGSVNVELNLAFQEAVCGDDNSRYCGNAITTTLKASREAFQKAHFLFVGSNGMLSSGSVEGEGYFNQHKYKQINFTYKREFTWEAGVIEQEDNTISEKEQELQNLIDKLSGQMEEAQVELGKIKEKS